MVTKWKWEKALLAFCMSLLLQNFIIILRVRINKIQVHFYFAEFVVIKQQTNLDRMQWPVGRPENTKESFVRYKERKKNTSHFTL